MWLAGWWLKRQSVLYIEGNLHDPVKYWQLDSIFLLIRREDSRRCFFLIFLVNVYLLSQREEKAKVLAYGNEVDLIPWHPPIPSEGPLGLPEHKRVLLCVQLLPRPPNPFWPDERQERTLCPHPPVFWSNASRPSFHLFVSHRQMAAHWYRTVSSIPLQRQKYNIN